MRGSAAAHCGFPTELLKFLTQMGVSEPLIQTSLLGEAVDHGPAAVFVADEDGRYVAVNQAACALLGYTREELLELRVSDVADPAGKWEQMEREGSVSGVSTLTCKDGTAVEFSYVAGATSVAGLLVYVSVGTAA
jgi:PAS domain S-box-containing protein